MKFKLTEVEQKVFDSIKHAVAQDTLLAYPDSNKRFYFHTDTRNYQLGAAISQDVKPIALYSR